MQRTLVIHTGGIGDFLLACPAIATLHAEGSVDILGRPDRAALAVAGNIAKRILDIENVGFESVWSEPTSKLRDTLRDYDRAVVFMRDDDRQIHDGLQTCGIEEVECFAGLPPDDWTGHASTYYLDCIGHTPGASAFTLEISPVAHKHDILVHPGSGGKNKNWPLEDYFSLTDTLRDAGKKIAWVLGPAEKENPVFEPLLARELGPVIEFESLVELASTLACADYFVGNDSGITHLAAAVGCPTIALFGPTDSARWAPLGNHVKILHWDSGAAKIIENVRKIVTA